MPSSALSNAMTAIDRALARVEFATLVAACAALFVTMIVVFADAAMRYLFNSPLKFTSDLVTMYLMSTALLLGLADTLRRGGHIGVDLFAHWMSRRVYHVAIGLALLLSAVVTTVIAYETGALAWFSLVQKETTVGIVSWPVWPSKAIVSLAFALMTLRVLHVGVSQLIAGLTGDESAAISIEHIEEEPTEDPV